MKYHLLRIYNPLGVEHDIVFSEEFFSLEADENRYVLQLAEEYTQDHFSLHFLWQFLANIPVVLVDQFDIHISYETHTVICNKVAENDEWHKIYLYNVEHHPSFTIASTRHPGSDFQTNSLGSKT